LLSVFLRGQNIVTQPPQLLHGRQRKVLVRIEQHPWSLHETFFAFLVFLDGTVDFLGALAAAYSQAASKSVRFKEG
jgi:hypothetical protein